MSYKIITKTTSNILLTPTIFLIFSSWNIMIIPP